MNKKTTERNVTESRLLSAATDVLVVVLTLGLCALCVSCKPKAKESPGSQREGGAGSAAIETSAPAAANFSFTPARANSTRAVAGDGQVVFERQNEPPGESTPGSFVAGAVLPPSPAARSNVIDLTRFYNATFYEVWHGGMGGNDLSTFPYGVQQLAGVDFDARGIVQVALMKHRFPQRVSGIPV